MSGPSTSPTNPRHPVRRTRNRRRWTRRPGRRRASSVRATCRPRRRTRARWSFGSTNRVVRCVPWRRCWASCSRWPRWVFPSACSGQCSRRTPRCSRPPRGRSTPSRNRSSRSPPTVGSACSGSPSGCSWRSSCGSCCVGGAARSGCSPRCSAPWSPRRWPGRWVGGSVWPPSTGCWRPPRPGRPSANPPTCGPVGWTGCSACCRCRTATCCCRRSVPLSCTPCWPVGRGGRGYARSPSRGVQLGVGGDASSDSGTGTART